MSGYLADTSIFIAGEQRRGVSPAPPGEGRISVATLTELGVGVRRAPEGAARELRRRTLAEARLFIALSLDEPVAERLADLLAKVRDAGHRAGLMDAIIAATALAHDLAVWTQDADFDVFAELEPDLVLARPPSTPKLGGR